MSERNKYPDFYKKTEGGVALDAEQLAVASRLFDETFDDIMLREFSKIEPALKSDIGRRAKIYTGITIDEQEYDLIIEDRSVDAVRETAFKHEIRMSEAFTRQITLVRLEGSQARETWKYRLCLDGVVRRVDLGDAYGKLLIEKELGLRNFEIIGNDSTLDSLKTSIEATWKVLLELELNHRLEADMGINNQPVTEDELKGLRDFLFE
jgi:hypothetical protein